MDGKYRPAVSKNRETISYEQYGGIVTIGLDQVEKIVYGPIAVRRRPTGQQSGNV